ncbi:MAG: DUF1566 domain-containing protein [Deltaproteobacteria bacterium]|nr:DUF1566 domain-containing protein [Deltaproteobacteria bacterium]
MTSPDRSYDICINGAGQDAQYGWDVTHADAERFTRDLSVSGNPVVVDNVTGLVWQGCAYGETGDDCASGSATQTDWSTQLANCDGLTWGGYSDWRLPDRYELQSIVSYGSHDPAIEAGVFPYIPRSYYWSSSSLANGSSAAWSVYFKDGPVSSRGKTYDGYARCVRWGPTPHSARFVRDTTTKGHPIVNDHEYSPSVATAAFPATPASYLWSSSSDGPYAWYVGFNSGYVDYSGKIYYDNRSARCVRSGS